MKKLFLLAAAVIGLGAIVPSANAHSCDYGRDAYIIEHGRPVYRHVYFDDSRRCYTYYGPRRVYVADYYYSYPRHYYPRPGLSFSFGFRG